MYENGVIYCHSSDTDSSDLKSYLTIAKDITSSTDSAINYYQCDYSSVLSGTNLFAGGMEWKNGLLYLTVATDEQVLLIKLLVIPTSDGDTNVIAAQLIVTAGGNTMWDFRLQSSHNALHSQLVTARSFSDDATDPVPVIGLS